jgi:hypothetical protein
MNSLTVPAILGWSKLASHRELLVFRIASLTKVVSRILLGTAEDVFAEPFGPNMLCF